MKIVLNTALNRFEALLSMDFQGDLAAVKTAGFKTDGPPTWSWWCVKVAALNKLRENRPNSGLEITNEAYDHYTRLMEMERQNAEARKLFAPIAEEQKKAKKQRRREQQKEQNYTTLVIPEKPGEDFDYIGKEDLPPQSLVVRDAYKRPTHPGPWCSYCGSPVYPYEKTDPIPTCLWCEKGLTRE
jgi:hypothetical protein